jgi:hypothetical protein
MVGRVSLLFNNTRNMQAARQSARPAPLALLISGETYFFTLK